MIGIATGKPLTTESLCCFAKVGQQKYPEGLVSLELWQSRARRLTSHHGDAQAEIAIMNYLRISLTAIVGMALSGMASAQPANNTPQVARPGSGASGAVSVASMNQINNVLADVQRTSEATAVDIARLRVDKWKADSNSKRQAQENSNA